MSNGKMIKISGICVREGISRNGRKYIATELNKFSKTMAGRPILRDHEATISSAIGTITKSESVDNGKIITYEANIFDDGEGTIEKIKRGILKEVSIGAIAGKIVKEKDAEDVIIPMDLECLELSLVVCPGNKNTSININTEENYTEEQLKEMITNYDKENIAADPKEKKPLEKQETETEKLLKKQIEGLTLKLHKYEQKILGLTESIAIKNIRLELKL